MKLRESLSTPVWLALLVFLVTASARLVFRFSDPGSPFRTALDPLERLEWMSYDWRSRLAAQPAPLNLSAVFIENETIRDIGNGSIGYAYGLYWPRHIYGLLARELSAQGAKAIGFDMLFGQLRPDQNVFSDWALTNAGLAPDAFFAEEIRRAGNVILASTAEVIPPPLFRTNAWGLGDITSERDADGTPRRLKPFRDYPRRLWHPEIVDLARKLNLDLDRASVTPSKILIHRNDGEEPYEVPMKPDGSLDMEEFGYSAELPPQKPFEMLRVWNLGIMLAAHELKLDLARAEIREREIILRGANGVERALPLDSGGNLLIHWALREPAKQDAFHRLLSLDYLRQRGQPRNEPERWKDTLAIVGSKATGSDLTDLGLTPLERGPTFLVSKYWNVADSILRSRFVRESPLWADLTLIAALGAAAAALVWNFSALWALLWTVCLAALYIAACAVVFVQTRCWLPMALPLAGGLGATYLALQTYHLFFEQNERRRMRSRFSRLVSPEIVNEILKAPNLTLSARRNLTVLFADVRGFTEFTDATQASAEAHARERQLSPEATAAYLDEQARLTLDTVNIYLGAIADTVKEYGGTLDKYIGDCVMAFWGAPLPDERHAVSCVRAAIAAQQRIAGINAARVAENRQLDEENLIRAREGRSLQPLLPVLVLGTGINTGKMTVGFMGSNHHVVNYTVFGREVNIASRLEGASGQGRIFISENTYRELLRDDPVLAAHCIELPPVLVKGIREPVPVREMPWQRGAV